MTKKLQKFNLIYSLVIMALLLTISHSCKKSDDSTQTPTPESTTVTDIDGNVYHKINLGGKVWMVENLKVTHYRNGEVIPNITDDTQWDNLTTGAFCNYGNLSTNGTIYGRLYNWYAVNDSRKLAPTGWHVATLGEWTTLVNLYGGSSQAGTALKEAGISHWTTPNSGTNTSGFTALPGGIRFPDFLELGTNGDWWTSTEENSNYARYIDLRNTNGYVEFYPNYKKIGFSVRCVKD